MLSAVENPLGPGRGGYQYPFGPSANSLLSPIGHPGLPNLNASSVAANLSSMSATEFVRPHPKPRYNTASALRNGLSSAPQRTKYADQQNGPVNLAVSGTGSPGGSPHSATTNLSPKIESINLDQQQSKECDVLSAYNSSSRLQFPSSSQLVGTNAYQALNYSLYGRAYGNPAALYPPHVLSSRAQMHHRPTYIPNQLDGYPSFLPPGTYSPPGGGPPVHLPPISSSLPIPSSASLQHLQQQLQQHHHHQQQQQLQQQQQQQQQQHHLSQNGLPPSSPSNKTTGYNGHIDRAILHPSSASMTAPTSSTSLAHHMPPSPLYSRDKEVKAHFQMLQHQHNLLANGGHNGKHQTIDMEFKVPSGKEGSLKHRILTRPYGEKDSKRRTSPVSGGGAAASIIRASDNSATTNFTKGSLIELASGDYRRIEDLRTEDFILSAEKSPDLQLADSTVVNIMVHNNLVVITFSYDSNRGKADIEATLEHPFFVYGQGWASCNPEGSQQLFGLKCQRLQVGDICISLKPREQKAHQQAKHQHMQPNDFQHRPPNSYLQHANMQQPKSSFPVSPSQTPQNLSKRPQTTTTNATDITPTSRIAPHLVPYSSVQSLATSTTAAPTPENRNTHNGENGEMNGRSNGRYISPPPQRRRPLSHENPTGNVDDSQPVSMVLNNKSQSPTTSEESVSSRKRRWSAPDMVDDDDEQAQSPPISQLART